MRELLLRFLFALIVPILCGHAANSAHSQTDKDKSSSSVGFYCQPPQQEICYPTHPGGGTLCHCE